MYTAYSLSCFCQDFKKALTVKCSFLLRQKQQRGWVSAQKMPDVLKDGGKRGKSETLEISTWWLNWNKLIQLFPLWWAWVRQAQQDLSLGKVMRSVGCVGPWVLSLYFTLSFLPLKPHIDTVEGPGRAASVWTPCWLIRQKFWWFSNQQ